VAGDGGETPTLADAAHAAAMRVRRALALHRSGLALHPPFSARSAATDDIRVLVARHHESRALPEKRAPSRGCIASR
jgi:glutathione S-transferase